MSRARRSWTRTAAELEGYDTAKGTIRFAAGEPLPGGARHEARPGARSPRLDAAARPSAWPAPSAPPPAPLRLAELLASVSLATDLGTGQPLGHALRTCTLAVALAEAMGCGADEVRTVHQFALLRFLGCTADAARPPRLTGGDDLAFNAAMAPALMGSGRELIGRFVRSVGAGEPALRRARLVARGLGELRRRRARRALRGRSACLPARAGLGQPVVEALAHAYERWDGKGSPAGLAGEAIPLAVRIASVARDVELATTLGARTHAAWLGERRGRAYDPAVVDAFEQVRARLRPREDGADEWEAALAVRAGAGRDRRARPARRGPGRVRGLRRPQVALAPRPLPPRRRARGGGRPPCRARPRRVRRPAARGARPRPGPGRRRERDLGQAGAAHDRGARAGAAARLLHRADPRPLRRARGRSSSWPRRTTSGSTARATTARARPSPCRRPARILAAADVFAALTADRPHRRRARGRRSRRRAGGGGRASTRTRWRASSPPRAGARLQRRHCVAGRPHRPRGRGAAPDRARAHEPRDRRAAGASRRRPSAATSRTSTASSASRRGPRWCSSQSSWLATDSSRVLLPSWTVTLPSSPNPSAKAEMNRAASCRLKTCFCSIFTSDTASPFLRACRRYDGRVWAQYITPHGCLLEIRCHPVTMRWSTRIEVRAVARSTHCAAVLPISVAPQGDHDSCGVALAAAKGTRTPRSRRPRSGRAEISSVR